MERGKIIRIVFGLLLVIVLGVGGYWRWMYITSPQIAGTTMGTEFHIRISGKVTRSDLKILIQQVDRELKKVNKEMSTWDPDSEIERFSHSTSTEPVKVSEDFAKVVTRALYFSKITDGAFDPTLEPLLDLWGFGSGGKGEKVPTDAEIAKAKAQTGWQKIKVIKPDSLQKSEPDVSLALGAIAKGYGVDAVGRILQKDGFENWFVEIGGEVVTKGLNSEGVPWKIGIQYPDTDPFDDRSQGILHMTHGAVATSGNYRNFMKANGKLYTHILDPRTGRTVLYPAASVSVYAPNCTDADGIATALFVMGPDAGLKWVEQHPEFEAMFLVCDDKGAITEKFSSGFVAATGYISNADAKRADANKAQQEKD